MMVMLMSKAQAVFGKIFSPVTVAIGTFLFFQAFLFNRGIAYRDEPERHYFRISTFSPRYDYHAEERKN